MKTKHLWALLLLVCPARGQSPVRYASPEELVLSDDGRRLYVACTGRDEIAVIDTRTRRVAARVKTGRRVRGLALSRDGRTLYAANSWDDTISEIDTASLRPIGTLPAGQEPIGVAAGLGSLVFVANRLSGDVSVLDSAVGREIKRISVGPGASYVTAAARKSWGVYRFRPPEASFT